MTYADSVLAAADSHGQLSYSDAFRVAVEHCAQIAFVEEYGSELRWIGTGIDAGELLVWLGY